MSWCSVSQLACLLTEMVQLASSRSLQWSDQLALSQSADQFQIEHRQGITPLGGVQIRADVVWVKDFHLLFFNFGDDAILRGIGENEFFFHRPVKGTVQHEMQTPNRGAAESWIAVTALAVDTPILHQLFVEFL